ncbi:MAG: HAD-IIIA family hydrolase [Candidatus Borkfalkiaceae bacterium]|nr:HAD-IIIA family hydrolase [Christensenellaceae bacterium]
MNKCLFLDRDGTIIKFGDGYNFLPEKTELIKGVSALIAKFCRAGYKIIVITNQGGIARGLYTEKDVYAVNDKINELLAPDGGKIDDIFFCPHDEKGVIEEFKIKCSCRKPEPLLLERAVKKHNADRAKSLFIGDNYNDRLCAEKVHVRFYPLEFRHVLSTSHGFRTEINEYSPELIQNIFDFAENA